MTDLVAIGAPGYRGLTLPPRRFDRDDSLRWDRYYLCAPIACGPGDECFAVLPSGMTGFDRYAFLRRFPRSDLTPPLVEALKTRATINAHGVEQLYDVAIHEDFAFVVSELVDGTSLAELAVALDTRGERFPWPVALALFCDTLTRLVQMRDAGVIHDGVARARVRVAYHSTLYLCHGLPRHHATASWGRALCTAALATLGLATGAGEAPLLSGILSADEPDALSIASDALIVRHPELDPHLPALALAARVADLAAIERAGAELARDLDTGPLWRLIAAIAATEH